MRRQPPANLADQLVRPAPRPDGFGGRGRLKPDTRKQLHSLSKHQGATAMHGTRLRYRSGDKIGDRYLVYKGPRRRQVGARSISASTWKT